MILSPAYGRDYKSAKAAKADFAEDKDFILEDFNNKYCGKPVNRSQLKESGERYVHICFKDKTKVICVQL